VPQQLLVRSPKAQNNITSLPHGTSIFDIRSTTISKDEIEEKEGLKLFSLPSALIASSPHFYSKNTMDARAALSMVRDASSLLTHFLEGGIVPSLAGWQGHFVILAGTASPMTWSRRCKLPDMMYVRIILLLINCPLLHQTLTYPPCKPDQAHVAIHA
jgi:hypothetical protein